MLEFQQDFFMGGRYKFLITNMETGRVRETDWTNNLITDRGIEMWLGSGGTARTNWASHLVVGDGIAAPVPGDLALGNLVAGPQAASSSVASITATGAPDYIVSAQHSYTFAQDTFLDNTVLNEVGTCPNVATDLVSRARITPSITVNAIEQVTVLFRLDLYVDQTIKTGQLSVVGGPQNVNYTLRAANAASSSHLAGRPVYYSRSGFSTNQGDCFIYRDATSAGTIENGAAPGAVNIASDRFAKVDNPTATSIRDRAIFTINEANSSTINSFYFSWGMGASVLYLDDFIVKDNTQELEIIIRRDFNRFTPP